MKSIAALFYIVAAGLLCMPMASSAQAAGNQNAPDSTPPAAANVVQGAPGSNQAGAITLDVQVTDKSGAPVTGLQAADFKLLDRKQPQNIVSVRAAASAGTPDDPPAVAILVVDAVNASILTVNSERSMIDKYFEENNGQLPIPIYLAIFTDNGMKVQTPATQDGKALEEFLNTNTTNLPTVKRPDGWWGDMERSQLSWKTLDYLTSQVTSMPGRKLFIWLSPGWRLQTNGQWNGASKSDQQGLYDKAASVSSALRAARVTIYSIDPWGSDSAMTFQQIYDEFIKGLDVPKHADYGYLLLQVLATQTGGEALYASNNLADLIGRCMEDVKAYYVLTFDPPPDAHPNEYHPIEVKVDKPGVKARTRTIYYSSPAAPAK